MPSTCSSFEPIKCGMVPLLGTPKVALPGLALSHATNCGKSLASIAGLAATANSKRASSEVGTKSLAVSKLGVTSVIGSRYMVGPVVTRIVEPSGAAPLTDLIPISPSPPVRSSTMTLRSSDGPRCCASTRQSASPLPPAAKGKMMRVSGPVWPSASAAFAASEKAKLPAMKRRRSIPRSLTYAPFALLAGGGCSGYARQHDADARSRARLALQHDSAAEMAGDNAVDDVQSQPRATLVAAGGEERIERLAPDILAHAAAVIGKNDLDVVVVIGPRRDAYGAGAAVGKGVGDRIEEQVGQHLTIGSGKTVHHQAGLAIEA